MGNARIPRAWQPVVVETVASPQALRERLRREHTASMQRLGERLVELELISREQLDHALRVQRCYSRRHLGQVLRALRYVSEAHLRQVICDQLGIAVVELERFPLDAGLSSLIPHKTARRYSMIALCAIDGELFVAMADPLDPEALEEARFCAQTNVVPVMALKQEIDRAIVALYDRTVIAYPQLAAAATPVPPARAPELSMPRIAAAQPESAPLEAPSLQSGVAARTQAPLQDAVVETIVSPEQLRERMERLRGAAMLKLGVRLVQLGLVTREQLEDALHVQRRDSRRHLGQVLVDLGYVSESHLRQVVCEQHGIVMVDLSSFPIRRAVLRLIPEKSARQHNMLPLCRIEGQLFVAMANPFDAEAYAHARFCAQMAIVPVVARSDDIRHAIRSLYDDKALSYAAPPTPPEHQAQLRRA